MSTSEGLKFCLDSAPLLQIYYYHRQKQNKTKCTTRQAYGMKSKAMSGSQPGTWVHDTHYWLRAPLLWPNVTPKRSTSLAYHWCPGLEQTSSKRSQRNADPTSCLDHCLLDTVTSLMGKRGESLLLGAPVTDQVSNTAPVTLKSPGNYLTTGFGLGDKQLNSKYKPQEKENKHRKRCTN